MSTSIAYFRLEGVLTPATGIACAAWMAANQAEWFGLAGRLGAIAMAKAVDATGVASSQTAHAAAWRSLTGCTEDRLVVLGETWWDDRLDGHWLPAGKRLLEACRAQGQRLVVLSDHPEVVVGPLAAALGVDEVICNHLEVADGKATGRLLDPVFHGAVDGGWLRRHAATHGADLSDTAGYGATAADATLLSAVARPCAVAPDRALRRLAHSFDWPIVEAA